MVDQLALSDLHAEIIDHLASVFDWLKELAVARPNDAAIYDAASLAVAEALNLLMPID